MNRARTPILTLLLAILLASSAQAASTKLIILHMNDSHGRLFTSGAPGPAGGDARLATLVGKIRAENPGRVLLLHAGDILSRGDAITNYYGGDANIDLMNRIGYDAFTPGNGEFYWGPVASDNLLRLQTKAHFPFLHANAVYKDTGQPFLKPYTVKSIAGCRVGILGLGAVREGGFAVRNLKPENVIECAKRYVPAVRKECDILVVLSHMALDVELKVVQEVPGIDLVVGAHSHERLDPPLRVAKPDGTGVVPIAHAGDYAQYLGRFDLDVDQSAGKTTISNIQGHLIPLDGAVPEEPEISRVLARYMKPLERVICYSEIALDNPPAGPSPMGSLLAEAIRCAAQADVGLVERGAAAHAIAPGPITLADAVTIAPWRDHIVTLALRGAELRPLLDSGAFLATIGERKSARRDTRIAVDLRIPLEDARVYTIAVSDFAQAGNKFLRDVAATSTPLGLDEALAQFLEKHKRITTARTGIMIASPPDKGAPGMLYLNCEPISTPIVIDGKGDDPAWDKVASVTDFRLWKTFAKPSEKTAFKICYDDNNLYVLFECPDPDIFTLYDTRDAALWESDSIELFLVPPEGGPIYYEFGAAPNKALFDAQFLNTGSGGARRWAAWNTEVQVATHVEGTLNNARDHDTGYTVEFAIPLKAFKEVIGDTPMKGQVWAFAAARADFSATLDAEEHSATANIPDGNMHKKDGYSALIFR